MNSSLFERVTDVQTTRQQFPSSPLQPTLLEPWNTGDTLALATSYCVALGLFRWERERRWGLVHAHPAMRVCIEAAFADIRDRALRLSSAEHAATACVETWARWIALRGSDSTEEAEARAMRTTVWAGAWTGHGWSSLACLRGRMDWPRQRADRDVSLSLSAWLELRLQEFNPESVRPYEPG